MSTPGGHGGYGQDPNQQYDPVTGQPLPPGGQSAAYPGPDTGGYHGLGQYPQTSAYPSNFPTGGFAPQPPPPPRKRTGLIVGVIAAVLVVAVGATLTIVLLNKKDDPQAGPGTPGSSTSSPPPTTGSPTTTATTATSAGVDPVYPGWQTVTVPDEHVQYDVPPDWQVESDDDASVSVPNTAATMEGVSTYKLGACPGQPESFRAKVGVGLASTETPDKTAKQRAQTWADALAKTYGGKTAAPSVSEQRVNRGQTLAYLAVVRVTTKKDACNPPRMLVAVLSFKSGSGSESVVLFGDQDVPDAISNEDAAKVLITARPTK